MIVDGSFGVGSEKRYGNWSREREVGRNQEVHM